MDAMSENNSTDPAEDSAEDPIAGTPAGDPVAGTPAEDPVMRGSAEDPVVRGSAEDPVVRKLWRRPALVAPAVAALLSGAVVLGVTVARDGSGEAAGSQGSGEAAGSRGESDIRLLERIATAAEKRPEPPPLRDDQFVYTKSTDDYMDASNLMDDRCVVQRQTLSDAEHWGSVDGSRWGLDRYHKDGKKIFEEKEHPKAWAGGKAPSNHRELEALPTDPDALYDWLHKGRNPLSRTHDSAFATAGEILGDNLVPPDVAAALYRAVAKLPGVTVVQDVRDALGRGGVAVGRTPEEGRERTEWIFDEKTLEYLGERRVWTEPKGSARRDGNGKCPPIEPGTVVTSRAITERAVVDKAGQEP
jgi:hypothetical protein